MAGPLAACSHTHLAVSHSCDEYSAAVFRAIGFETLQPSGADSFSQFPPRTSSTFPHLLLRETGRQGAAVCLSGCDLKPVAAPGSDPCAITKHHPFGPCGSPLSAIKSWPDLPPVRALIYSLYRLVLEARRKLVIERWFSNWSCEPGLGPRPA